MKLFAKRALILTIFVLCLFGLTVLAASAAGTEYASDAAAVEAGAVARIGDEGGAGYYTDLATAISEAASGDTVTVLKDTSFATATTISGKTLTIQGASKDVVLTTSAALTLTGDAALSVSDITLESSATFIKTSTATNGNSFSMENVGLHVSAMTANVGLINPTSKIAIEIADVDITTTVGKNSANKDYAVWIIYVGANGTVAPLSITNTSTTTALVRVESSTAVVGTSEAPATLTDITQSAGCPLYGYGGTIYANIFGGSFAGALLYGGDGSNNTLNIKVNPTGDKTTTVTRAGTSSSVYSAWVHLNAKAVHDVSFLLRNVSYTDTGAAPLFAVRTATNLSITVENCTFDMSGAKLSSLPDANGATFDSDATATLFGYAVRIGEEGGVYYKRVDLAANAAPADDGNGGATMVYVLANTTMTNVGSDGGVGTYFDAKFRKKIHITSKGETPFTVTTSGTINFYLGSGAEVTFTNITFNIGNRLARVDGSCSIIFGKGCTMNHTNTIFIYDNGNTKNNDYLEHKETDPDTGKEKTVVDNPSYVENLTYSIEVREGALIRSTGAIATGLFYRSSNVSTATITVKIEGEINMTANKPIFYDNGKATTTVYVDVSRVTCGATGSWFTNVVKAIADTDTHSMIYAKGFASTDKGAEWGYNHTNATAMTYSADPDREWNYTFIYHSQLIQKQYNVLNSYGGEMWQLRSVGSARYSQYYYSLGTITLKSYNKATITLQDAGRMRVQNTTFIIDGIKIIVNNTTSNGVGYIGIHGGSEAAPSILKLVNGAQLVGTAWKSGQLIYIMSDNGAAYSNFYMDESSSILMNGAGEVVANNHHVIYAHSNWKNGSITIKGTITSAAEAAGQTNIITVGGAANGCSILLDGATLEFTGAPTSKNTVSVVANSFAGVVKVRDMTFTDYSGLVICVDDQDYYGLLASAVADVPAGGEKELQIIGTLSLTAPVEIYDQEIVLIGNNNANYDLKFEGAADSVAFIIYSKGVLTFQDMNIWTKAQLVSYNANRTVEGEQATKNIVISLVNTDVTATITSRYAKDVGYAGALISSSNHYATDRGGCGEQAYSVTVNIDKDSVINFTTATANAWFIAFNHNSHPNTYANIEGQVIMNATYAGTDANRTTYLVRSNNPSLTHVTITETAKVKVTISDALKSATTAIANATTGSTVNNRLNIHLDAIIDENGALALDGMQLFSSGGAGNAYAVHIAAKDSTLKSTLTSWTAKVASADLTPISLLVQNGGTHHYYYNDTIVTAIADMPAGSEATINILAAATFGTPITLENKKVTIVGMDATIGDATYDLTYNGGGYMFNISNLAELTFQNVNFKTGRPLISYKSTALTTVAQEDKDITISFLNSYLNYSGSSRFIISNNNGSSTAGTQCDTFTFNVDETSTVSWVANSTDPRYMFYFNHGSHTNIVLNIAGTVSFKDHTAYDNAAIFFYSNNPTSATVTFTETAHLIVDIADPIAVDRIFQCTTGTNKLTIHEKAILDENGALTLSGMRLFRQYSVATNPTTVIIADSNANEVTWLGLIGEDNSTNPFPIIKYRAIADGAYYYTNTLSAAVERVNGSQGTAELYLFKNDSVSKGAVLNGVTVRFTGADDATLNSTAANLFTLTNGAKLTIEGMTITSTAATTSAATVGTFLRVDEAEETAKCTVTLNNVTLTASTSIPFYFGGVSEVDVVINGGSYTGKGMFSFGVASGNLGAAADIYFAGTANVTVTGTADKHVIFDKPANFGDTSALIFINAPSVVKDSVKVIFDYVDASASGHAIYLRNYGALTLDYSNGNLSSDSWVIGSQSTTVPYMTFTNVDITGTSGDHIMRPYSGTAGAYIKFIGGSITANKVAGSNPILNFNSKMDVTFDGVTFNSTSTKALIGGTATSYTMIDCSFNVTGPVLAKTSYTMIMKNSKIQENGSLVAVSVAKAAEMGFAIAVNEEAYYSSGFFGMAMDDIEEGSTATVKLLAKVTYSGLMTIRNKNLTFVGKDSTVNDLAAASSANADLYFSTTAGGTYVITLQDKATLTFQNIAVFSNRPLFSYGTTDLDLAKADRDITLNFVNSWVSGGSGSSVFMGGGGSSGKCDAFTINVDATSKLMFAPVSDSLSTMFYANYTAFASFTVNLNGAIEITDRCTTTARPIWMFNADTAVPLTFNVSDTASIKFTCNEAQAAADHAMLDSSASAKITIAAAAITDAQGKSTLGDMYLYNVVNAGIPELCITHTSNSLADTLKAMLAMVGEEEETPIDYFVLYNNVYYYFNSRDAAQAFATANGATVESLNAGVFADVAAAVSGGAIFRLGGAVVDGELGVHYFEKLSDLMEYATTHSMTDITVYVLTSGKTDGSTVALSGIKLTLDSVDSTKQTLTLSAAPAFKLQNNSHLVIKNVKILMSSAFVSVDATGAKNTAKLDLEANAEIEAANFSGGYFLRSYSTALLTVNLNEGSSIKMMTNGTVVGAHQGMFDFTTSSNIVAEGSSITIDGTLIYALTFDASNEKANARRAAMFKVGDKTLDLYFTEHANVQLLHVNALAGTWNNIVCLDTTGAESVVTFTGGKYTTTTNCGLIGLNGTGYKGTFKVTDGADVSGVSAGLVCDYGTASGDNSTVILFKDVDLSGVTVSQYGKLAYVQLENVVFADDGEAAVNYGVRVEGLTNYYSLNKAVELAADDSTITLLGDVTGANAVLMNKTLTIQSADAAHPVVITNGGFGSTFIFSCYGNSHLTLKNLQINAKARAVRFERESYIGQNSEGKDVTLYYDVTSSSLNLINTDIYGVAVGDAHNAMILVGTGSGHHNFDLHIDATSSVGYQDGDPSVIKSTRNYQVIFYNVSVTGNVLIEGEVFAYVYFQGDQVNYEGVKQSWAKHGPNAQYMISIGNDSPHTFVGDIVIAATAKLTHKVVFPSVDENGDPVYYEDYPYLHSAYAIRVYGGNASVIEVDGAAITTNYTKAHPSYSGRIGFDGAGDAIEITYNTQDATLHYYGIGGLLASLKSNEYAGNTITIADASGSYYNIIYNKDTFISTTKEEDTGIAESGGHDYYGATEIAELLNKLTGRSDISAVKDSTTTTKEIIVGIANRDVVQTYLHQLEMNEFAIVFKGDKILVLAWNEAALNLAVASFKSALELCADGTTVALPAVPDNTVYKFVANAEWRVDFDKPADGTLWGGQYVNNNSLQYVYNGYADTREGHAAFTAYCDALERAGYTVVWQNVIGENLFRLYSHAEKRLSLYVAYNDYTYKDKYYGTNGEDGLYGEEETDKTEIPSNGDMNDEYFENRDHQKVIRVVSMPHASVKDPTAESLKLDMSYTKLTNTMETTLSFRSTSVGLGHVYMLEDGSFVVIDGGGTGYTNSGDVTEQEAIWQVMLALYKEAHDGAAPDFENGEKIHLRAWYLTHAHWDHISAFTSMMTKHGENIEFDYVIGNFMDVDSTYRGHGTSYDPTNVLLSAAAGKRQHLKVWAGQRIFLANLEIEVLMTYTDHAPFRIINSNDSNTVTRFKIHNQDAMNGVTAEILYLGDSWRHSSRILTEMYDTYLQTEIVQLAHHGNIGCERVLYKAIAPRAVYFSHDASPFKNYVYHGSFSNAEAAQEVAYRYAADIWCAYNAEYMWSAPYGTYNTLEFLPARPDYENIFELGIQPGKTAGTLITSEYDTSYSHTSANQKSYIHNVAKGYKEVNVVWGDLSFSYDDGQGSLGTWNPATHEYEGATPGTGEAGWKPNGDNRIWVGNASTGNAQDITVELSFAAATGYTNFTGSFSDNGTASLVPKSTKIFTFTLGTTTLPATDITDQVIGSITVTLK